MWTSHRGYRTRTRYFIRRSMDLEKAYLKKVPRRLWFLAKESKIEYQDTLVICVKFAPVSLIKMRKMDYFWEYLFSLLDEPSYPKELDKAEEFFERIVNDVFEEYDLGYAARMGGFYSFCPVQDVDFGRKRVYGRRYRMVLVLDRRFTLNPFGTTGDDTEPSCIYANNKKLKTYEELEEEIREWLSKIKKETDPFKKDSGHKENNENMG